MGQFYSNEDVARWDKSYGQSVDLHLEKLSADLPQEKVDFHLSNLSGSYYMQGMTLIAKSEFRKAIEAFRASAQTKFKMYERFENGQGRSLEAGNFQSLLVAFVTRDEALVSQLVGKYRAEDGTPGSIFLGRALKLIAMSDLDGAKIALREKKPRFEPQFIGYTDCLEAIANKDEHRFLTALKLASDSWAKWAVKRVNGLPDSVCFIQGVGLVRLAERVMGKRISVVDENIPLQLLL